MLGTGQTEAVPPRDEPDPRIERSRLCVLEAAADLLREVGYGSLTIEAVAARSGVAKSTIYRHWRGKADLAADAFRHVHLREEVAPPPPGPLVDRVVAVLRDLTSAMGQASRLACMMPALIDAAERSDEIGELTRELADESAGPLVQMLDEAVEAGELPVATDTRRLADALVGPIVLARLFHRPPIEDDDVPALVAQILPAPGRSPVGG